ncbi:MAG TPA: undecaprenyl-diphosphate phosphatase [Candidatus Paceibacterota bacterium]|nr:undecaprenyl-diphosphate phosphatase [Candidatus Paceibacterota bacterium]
MLNGFTALILGLVEGFTEFLPISSTAHLIIATRLLGFAQSEFAKTFDIAIQSGAILAVVALYWRRFLDVELLKKLVAAFIPTGILGLLFYKVVKNYLLGSMTVVLWSLAVGGLLIIIFENFYKKEMARISDARQMTYGQAALIGVAQSVAMIPGVSRAAATAVGGMLLGVSREAIVEFSFLLAVPTMLAATGLDLVKSAGEFSAAQFDVLGIGFVVSFLMAIVSIKFLLNYIRRHTFTAFGVYRMALVLAAVLFAL